MSSRTGRRQVVVAPATEVAAPSLRQVAAQGDGAESQVDSGPIYARPAARRQVASHSRTIVLEESDRDVMSVRGDVTVSSVDVRRQSWRHEGDVDREFCVIVDHVPPASAYYTRGGGIRNMETLF